MTSHTPDPLIEQQIAYYRRRASEYDEWFLRQGRYDRGPELNRCWYAEAATLRAVLQAFAPTGHVLELACGTGLWTEHLARYADGLTAVDASPEMLALNQARVHSDKVRYVRADLFTWQPDRVYDVVFFSFWLSHVPPERFVAFWRLVRSCLGEDGRVFFIDSLYESTSTARDHQLGAQGATTSVRRLNDGQVFEIVKVFYEPADLAARLKELGWSIAVEHTGDYFLSGHGGLTTLL